MVCESREREQGFLLLGLVVAIFLILLALSVAAPKMSRELQREREVETVHRGNQYVRAIQLYYRKFGHYPGSMEQLAKTNEIRFLRQDYVDPMTGKVDWRLIKVGENKTTVKGFFGKPLAGLAAGGLGSAAGMASSTSGTGQPAGASTFGGASSMGSGMGGTGMGGASSPGFTLGTSGSSQPGSSGAQPGGSSGSMFGSSGGAASTSVSNLGASSGPFVGVGLVKDGDSIVEPNEQTTYKTWEFIYDPRIEQLKAKGAMMGGGNTGFGSSTGSGSSGFGSSSFGGGNNSSGFGGTGSTGFGNSTSPASNAPAAPTSNPNPQ